MASRSLGTLTLDLVAKIGGFESGMDRAARTADKKTREIERAAKARAKEIEKAFEGIGSVISGAIAGVSVGAVFTKFITETKNAEQEQAQLAAVIRSTGQAAGWSQDRLNDMADELSKSSIFSAGDINQAQTRLLSYSNVVGETVPKAMQAVLDMSSRLGMDLKQSSETIGKALDVPSQGLSALSKQGFRFTDDQKKLVEQLEKTGKTAQAQGIILDALSSSYGGAAAAARDTFGGALAALQNNIDDLLTGDSGSMSQMKESVEVLNRTLTSDETRAAFQTFTGWLAEISSKVIQASADVVNFLNSGAKARIVGDYALSEFGVGGREKGDRFAGSNINAIRKDIEASERGLQQALAMGDTTRVKRLETGIREAHASLEYFKGLQRQQALGAVDGYADEAARRGIGRPTAPTGGGSSARGSTGGGGRGSGGKSDFEKTLENLRKQIESTEHLTEVQKIQAAIEEGRIKNLLPGQERELLLAAQKADAAKENAKVVKQTKDMEEEMQKFLGGLSADQTKRARDEAEALSEQNKQMREELEVMGLSAEAKAALEQARLSSSIAVKEEALASRELTGATQGELDGLREQIRLLKERAGLLTDKSVKEAQIESRKTSEQMAGDMQRMLGDSIFDAADGNFKKIADSWLTMLKRMAADAAAAGIMKALLGSGKGGG